MKNVYNERVAEKWCNRKAGWDYISVNLKKKNFGVYLIRVEIILNWINIQDPLFEYRIRQQIRRIIIKCFKIFGYALNPDKFEGELIFVLRTCHVAFLGVLIISSAIPSNFKGRRSKELSEFLISTLF